MPHSTDDPRVGDVSEGRILARILAEIGPSRAIVGPGDDAAVLAAPDGRVVVTTDTLVHGPDFRLAWSSAADLGWKAAAVNLADVAAMGARPTALFIALAMPDDTRLSFVADLARGLRDACDSLAPGCAVEGGDLTVSDTLTIAVTAIGVLDGRDPVLRSGAQPGDVVTITGDAGVAAEGLEVLFGRFRDASGVLLPVRDSPHVWEALSGAEARALGAQLRPRPPVQTGAVLAAAGATAMMDVSDGLALDATRLAEASGVTLDLDRARIGGGALALSGGEDHALLATIPPEAAEKSGLRVIGRVLPRGEAPLLVDGAPYAGRTGWDPYRDWDSARG